MKEERVKRRCWEWSGYKEEEDLEEDREKNKNKMLIRPSKLFDMSDIIAMREEEIYHDRPEGGTCWLP